MTPAHSQTSCITYAHHEISETGKELNYTLKTLPKKLSGKVAKRWTNALPKPEKLIYDLKLCAQLCQTHAPEHPSPNYIVAWDQMCTIYHLPVNTITINTDSATESHTAEAHTPLIVAHPTYPDLPLEIRSKIQKLFTDACKGLNSDSTLYKFVWVNDLPKSVSMSEKFLCINNINLSSSN